MQAFFKIFNCYPNVHETKPAYKLREYFIAAQEQVWNYAPNFPKERFVQEKKEKKEKQITLFC